jgi:hypothetical protein
MRQQEYDWDGLEQWAYEKYKEIDKYYAHEIECPKLREIFIRSLAHAWGCGDDKVEKELRDCDFSDVVYYYIIEDLQQIRKLWVDEQQHRFELSAI